MHREECVDLPRDHRRAGRTRLVDEPGWQDPRSNARRRPATRDRYQGHRCSLPQDAARPLRLPRRIDPQLTDCNLFAYKAPTRGLASFRPQLATLPNRLPPAPTSAKRWPNWLDQPATTGGSDALRGANRVLWSLVVKCCWHWLFEFTRGNKVSHIVRLLRAWFWHGICWEVPTESHSTTHQVVQRPSFTTAAQACLVLSAPDFDRNLHRL